MKIDVKHEAVLGEVTGNNAPAPKDAAQETTDDANAGRKKPSFLQMMVSVMQASFGVQTDANRERDFEHGSIAGFVAAALIFTVVFVVSLLLIVQVVLP